MSQLNRQPLSTPGGCTWGGGEAKRSNLLIEWLGSPAMRPHTG